MKKMVKHKAFFETFCGEFCEIVQDYEITTQVSLTEEGATNELRMPMTVVGFVMDSDEGFLFLSEDGEEVREALPISSIKHIRIVSVPNPLDSILDDIEVPEGSYN